MYEYVETRLAFWARHLLNRAASKLRSPDEAPPRLCAFPNDLIGREMAMVGLYERAGVEALRWLCREKVVDSASEGVLLDVGANLGTYAISLSREFRHVVAVEPNPVTFRLLQFNAWLNNCENMAIHQLALSDEAGCGQLLEPEDNVGASHLLESGSAAGSYRVDLVRGDDLLRDQGDVRIAMIKIDVEGHERPALEGLRETILRDRPVICFEANDNVGYQAVRQFLSPLGYVHFCALDYWPSPRSKWLKISLLTLLGVRYRLKSLPAVIRKGNKYSLVVATVGRWQEI